MAVFHGVGINFGVGSTIVGVNGAFQSREHSYRYAGDLIRDAGNTTVSKVYYDPAETAIFTYVAVQPSSNPFGNSTVDIPIIGEFIQVVDPNYPAIAGYWLVDEISVAASNTSAARVTLHLTRYPYLERI
jgi:hypothetical protein